MLVCSATLALAAPPAAPSMELRFDRLASALTLLSDSDRKIVDEAAQLIREGENVGALTRLSALTESNSNNSSKIVLLKSDTSKAREVGVEKSHVLGS